MLEEKIKQIGNIAALLRWRVAKNPDSLAFQSMEESQWKPYSWKEVDLLVEKIAGGLISLGFQKEDKASIMGATQLSWCLSDLAILRSAGVSVGIYPTLTGAQATYIIHKSESMVLFVEDEAQLEKIKPHFQELPLLKYIIVWKKGKESWLSWQDHFSGSILTFEQLMQQGAEALKKNDKLCLERETQIQSTDLANLVFTSGTTGHPKGACLSHYNILAELFSLDETARFVSEGDSMVIFLPLAHVGEKIGGLYNRIYQNVSGSFIEDLTQVVEALKVLKPSSFGSVPRIFEKVHSKVMSQVNSASPFRQRIFRWALGIGKKYYEAQFRGLPVSSLLKFQFKIADSLVLKKLRGIFGGNVKYCVSGAAPISLEIIEFFLSMGLLILEGYGQTETSCFITMNTIEDYRFGSVGKAVANTEIRIAADGEIMVKGPLVFQGYYKEEELSKAVVSPDGWLATGDIGHMDQEGFVYITGRKKDIIITSGGKNITPSNIEVLLTNHPLIEQAVVHGDRRKYLTALLATDIQLLRAWAKEREIPEEKMSAEDLLGHPVFLEELRAHVHSINQHLAQYETIKDFRLLPRLLDIENGEITPTLKVKRNVVQEKYRTLLDEMYEMVEK